MNGIARGKGTSRVDFGHIHVQKFSILDDYAASQPLQMLDIRGCKQRAVLLCLMAHIWLCSMTATTYIWGRDQVSQWLNYLNRPLL